MKKVKNNSLPRQKNNEMIIIIYKGKWMVKDGEDQHGLQTKNLKNLDKNLFILTRKPCL